MVLFWICPSTCPAAMYSLKQGFFSVLPHWIWHVTCFLGRCHIEYLLVKVCIGVITSFPIGSRYGIYIYTIIYLRIFTIKSHPFHRSVNYTVRPHGMAIVGPMKIPFRHQPPPAWLLPWLHHMLSLGVTNFGPEMGSLRFLGMKTYGKKRFWMVRIRWFFLDTTNVILKLRLEHGCY